MHDASTVKVSGLFNEIRGEFESTTNSDSTSEPAPLPIVCDTSELSSDVTEEIQSNTIWTKNVNELIYNYNLMA